MGRKRGHGRDIGRLLQRRKRGHGHGMGASAATADECGRVALRGIHARRSWQTQAACADAWHYAEQWRARLRPPWDGLFWRFPVEPAP